MTPSYPHRPADRGLRGGPGPWELGPEGSVGFQKAFGAQRVYVPRCISEPSQRPPRACAKRRSIQPANCTMGVDEGKRSTWWACRGARRRRRVLANEGDNQSHPDVVGNGSAVAVEALAGFLTGAMTAGLMQHCFCSWDPRRRRGSPTGANTGAVLFRSTAGAASSRWRSSRGSLEAPGCGTCPFPTVPAAARSAFLPIAIRHWSSRREGRGERGSKGGTGPNYGLRPDHTIRSYIYLGGPGFPLDGRACPRFPRPSTRDGHAVPAQRSRLIETRRKTPTAARRDGRRSKAGSR